jgi:SET domain-containing protein
MSITESRIRDQLPLDKVEMKKSHIHGLGVFAKQMIHKGELITIYPTHCISFFPQGRGNTETGRYLTKCNEDLNCLMLNYVIVDSYANC